MQCQLSHSFEHATRDPQAKAPLARGYATLDVSPSHKVLLSLFLGIRWRPKWQGLYCRICCLDTCRFAELRSPVFTFLENFQFLVWVSNLAYQPYPACNNLKRQKYKRSDNSGTDLRRVFAALQSFHALESLIDKNLFTF